jgi:hypothetical protein
MPCRSHNHDACMVPGIDGQGSIELQLLGSLKSQRLLK